MTTEYILVGVIAALLLLVGYLINLLKQMIEQKDIQNNIAMDELRQTTQQHDQGILKMGELIKARDVTEYKIDYDSEKTPLSLEQRQALRNDEIARVEEQLREVL